MTYTVKRKLVLVSMLVLMLLMLVPFEALAQETVDDTASSSQSSPFYCRSFYAEGRHWEFYKDASGSWAFRSSTDGATWSGATALSYFSSLYFDGDYVHKTGTSGSYTTDLNYQRGHPNSDGTITWGTNYIIASCPSNYTSREGATVTLDGNGYPYVSYIYYEFHYGCSGTCNYHYHFFHVTKSSTKDGVWTTEWDTRVTSHASNSGGMVLGLTGGKIVALHQPDGNVPIYAKRWTGSGWGSEVNSASSVISSSYSAIAQDDTVHVVALEATSYDIFAVDYSYSTNSFSAETDIYSAATSTSVPAMSMDSANNLHVFWENDPTDDHVYYAKYLYSNSTWVSYYDLINEIDLLPATGYYLNTDYTCDENRVGVYYIAGTTILKFKLLSEVFEVDTLSASPVGLTSATLRGEIVSLGFGSADERGFVLNDSPTLVGASLEGNETGTFNVGVFTHGVTGLDVFSTYWYAAYASNEWGTEYGDWTSFDTVLSIPTPPSGNVTGDTATICNTTAWNFLAMPITNTDIKLTWDWYPTTGNSSVQISIRYDLYHYPSNTTDGTLIYQGTSDAYTHTNLTPGTTYYYRGWLLCGGNYSADYVEDWATTYGSSPVVSPPEQPGGWFQDPSCIAYGKIPLLSDALTAITTGYGFPMTTVCVMFTLLWIIILGFVIFLFIHSAMMMIITIAVLIILASIMGLLPLWMIVIAICLGGISIYVSSRT